MVKPVHCSNIENLAIEFPEFMTNNLKRKEPFNEPRAPGGLPTGEQEERELEPGKTTKDELKKQARKWADETWNARWNRTHPKPKTAAKLRQITREPGTTSGPALYKDMNRPTAAIITQLRTEHCGLNHYLWRFKKRESAECEKCGYAKETVEHYLLECPAYWRERAKVRTVTTTGRMTVASLLGDKRVIETTIEYVKETKRFNIM